MISPSTNNVKRSGPRSELRSTWPAFLLLLVGLALTFAACRYANNQVDAKLQSVFDAQNVAVINKLNASIDEHSGTLQNLVGFYDGNVQVVRDVFELFAAVPANMRKSIKTIAYAPRISNREKEGYELYARNQGLEYLSFAITPSTKREEYFPLEYLVPFSENRAQLGYDLASDPVRREAVAAARRRGNITATPVLTLADGIEGFCLFAPLYRPGSSPTSEKQRIDAFIGVVMIEIHSDSFIRKAVKREADSSLVALSVYDGLSPDPEHLLYSEVTPRDPIMEQQIHLHFANHSWTIVSRSKPSLRDVADTSIPTWVMIGGSVFTLLLFGFVFSLVTSRGRAVTLAENMTRAQRRIVDSSLDLIGSLDSDGVWRSMNPASARILGYTAQEMIGRKHSEFIFAPDRPRFTHALETAVDENPISISVRHVAKQGSLHWIDWSITVSKADGLMYGIGRDSTAHVFAEQEITRKNLQLDLAGMITDRVNLDKQRSIREQSFRFRMQLTTVMGFLHLILADKTAEKEEILDYVETAHEGAEGLLSDVQELTEVELRTMEDVVFDMSDHAAAELVRHLLETVDTFETCQGLTLPKDIGSIPEHRIRLDLVKLRDVMRLILELLCPHINPASGLAVQCERKTEEGWFVVELLFTNLVQLPDTSRWIPSLTKEAMLHLEVERDFVLALLPHFLKVMDAELQIENSATNDACAVTFRFLL